jgi:hypothetical protein
MFDIPLEESGLRIMPELKYANKVHGVSAIFPIPVQGTLNYTGTSTSLTLKFLCTWRISLVYFFKRG